MAPHIAPEPGSGWKAADFSLVGIDGKTYTLADVRGPKGTVVMFICNHCPYVRAVIDRVARDIAALQAEGIGAIAIMPNDYAAYPADSPDNMTTFAAENGFTFPYVVDEIQDTARAYDAVCTPEFFGFNADLEIEYRGRLDESGRHPAPPTARRELYEAMIAIARTGRGPKEQHASMGCSVKWRS